MSPILGSRSRFLYRVSVYVVAPFVGLFVFLDNPDDARGQVIGGLAMVAGAMALVVLTTRLRDPWGAIRYALRPLRTLTTLLARWDRPDVSDTDLCASLQAYLRQQLPDVDAAADHPDDGVLTLGDELTIVPEAFPQTEADRDGLLARLDALRSPLESRALVVVLASNGDDSDRADLSMLDRARGVHLIRV